MRGECDRLACHEGVVRTARRMRRRCRRVTARTVWLRVRVKTWTAVYHRDGVVGGRHGQPVEAGGRAVVVRYRSSPRSDCREKELHGRLINSPCVYLPAGHPVDWVGQGIWHAPARTCNADGQCIARRWGSGRQSRQNFHPSPPRSARYAPDRPVYTGSRRHYDNSLDMVPVEKDPVAWLKSEAMETAPADSVDPFRDCDTGNCISPLYKAWIPPSPKLPLAASPTRLLVGSTVPWQPLEPSHHVTAPAFPAELFFQFGRPRNNCRSQRLLTTNQPDHLGDSRSSCCRCKSAFASTAVPVAPGDRAGAIGPSRAGYSVVPVRQRGDFSSDIVVFPQNPPGCYPWKFHPCSRSYCCTRSPRQCCYSNAVY